MSRHDGSIRNRLLYEVSCLPKFDIRVAEAYEHAMPDLVNTVHNILQEHPRWQENIGFSPIAMIRLKHIHHGKLLANILRYACYSLFVDTLIWEYRAYHNHNFAYDYFAMEIGAWRTAVRQFLPSELADSVDRIYGWMAEHHPEFIACARLGNTDSLPLAQHALYSPMLDGMLQGDYHACVSLAQDYVHDRSTMAEFYRHVLAPCLYAVGQQWENGDISVADEHMATAVAERVMTAAYTKTIGQCQSADYNGRIVVASTEDEEHSLGIRMFADILELDGWYVRFLGANLPASDLCELLEKVRPDIIGISLVMPYNVRKLACMISDIRQVSALAGSKIMIGGQALRHEPNLWQVIGADSYVADLDMAVQTANNWRKDLRS